MRINRTSIIFLAVLSCIALISEFTSSAKSGQQPSNLVAWDGGRYVQLNWDTDLGMAIQGYNIYRSVKRPDNWEKINETVFPFATFIDYSPPRPQLVFYRVIPVNENGEELHSSSVVSVSTGPVTSAATIQVEAAQAYDKNNIITDSQLTNAGAMSAGQIQTFLSGQGSVLANYSSGGKTAAQRIYDDCQTHGISPYVVLVTLQKEKSLIKSSTANPNSFAMGWNTGDSSTADFANQIYYGTRQFKLYYNNLGGYGWTVGQSHSVSDGTVTAANIASAGLYIYTPWIGQGGGGQAGVGGNYLFWDLWYNTFGFGSSALATPTSDGFDYPVGKPNGTGWLNNHNGLGFLDLYNYGGTCGFTYHPGNDFNKDGTTGDEDRYEPVYAVSNGTVIDSAYYGTSTWGNVILIEHNLPDGSKVWSQYGHLENRLVQTGAVVARGDQIGRVGKGDGSLAAHLHFEIRKVLLAASAFPCGQSQTYVTDRYYDPIGYLDSHRSLSGCGAGTSTLLNRDGGPPIHPPGSVIKVASDPTVYLIDPDNRKRPLSASALSQLYNQSTDSRTSTNFSSWVITVGQDELDLYELGGSIFAAQPGNGQPFPDGKLISYNGEVSIVTGVGKRRPFVTESTFTGLGFKFCQVVNVSLTEYNSYPVGSPVDAMALLTSSVNLSPAGSYTVGQNITGSFVIKNVGYQSLPFSSLGIGGRLNGSTVYDLGFVSTTLAAGSSYPFGSQAVQLTSAGTYDFFAAYQEGNGHWAISIPVAPGVVRSRQITVGNTTPPPAPTANAATNVASGSFTANWSSSSGATGYQLDVSTSSIFSTFVSGYQNLDVGNALSRSVTGLIGGTTYYYRLRAYNSGGTSSNSVAISVTTTAPNYIITVSASPNAGGSVGGGGTFPAGSSRTVTATANSGYAFTNWTENNSVVSSSASYSFTLNGNRNLVANFTAVATLLPPPTLVAPGTTTAPGSSISTLTPTFQWQSVTGADGYGFYVSRFNGSTYDLIFNSETDVGQPLTGTSYVLPAGRLQDGGQYRWNMSTHNSAGYGTPNATRYYFYVSLPTQNYAITVSASPSAGGTVSGSGTFAAGSSRTVTATANSGYTFSNWTENGSVVSSSASYTFTLNANRTLVANFTTTGGPPPAAVQFNTGNYFGSESDGSLFLVVTRTGNTSGAATVDYSTNDFMAARCDTVGGAASAKCDYVTNGGTLRFAAGVATQTIRLSIIDDAFVEGNETLTIALSNPTGTTLGSPASSTITIVDNDSDPNASNPFLNNAFFVREQYLDFLLREPDSAGYNDWLSVLNGCGPQQGGLGAPAGCDRVQVSSGFFRSPEFGEKGYWIYRFYEASLGRRPLFAEFTPEMRRLSGLMTDAEQETRRADFISRFMQLPEFTSNFAGLTDSAHATQFIAKLEQIGRVTLPATATTDPGQPPQYGRQQLINLMASGQFTAAQTLRAFIEQKVVWDTYFYRAFVAMQYFGYLRRDPEAAGYDDWVDVLTNGRASAGVAPGDYRHLIFGFVYSVEYRERFGKQ